MDGNLVAQESCPDLPALPVALTRPIRATASTPRPRGGYLVMLTTGAADGGQRATLAFAWACAASTLEIDSRVFLIGDGSYWAYAGHPDPVAIHGFPRLAELMQDFTDLGGTIYLCSSCDRICSAPPADDPGGWQRRPDVQTLGLTAVISQAIGRATVTF